MRLIVSFAALIPPMMACKSGPPEPERSPYEVVEDHLNSLLLAYDAKYQETQYCFDLPLWPSKAKDCSNGCDPSVWDAQGEYKHIGWRPADSSYGHFEARGVRDNPVDKTICEAYITAILDLDGDKQFMTMYIPIKLHHGILLSEGGSVRFSAEMSGVD